MENYSLWIIPDDQTTKRLQSVINNLAKKYNTPTFIPHITVYGEMSGEEQPLLGRLEKWASKQKNFELQLTYPEFSTTYFQCVFQRVNVTSELMELHTSLASEFNLKNLMYMPHLSLLYGDFDMKLREKIVKELNTPEAEFLVQSVVLWKTDDPDPTHWKFVGEFEFKE